MENQLTNSDINNLNSIKSLSKFFALMIFAGILMWYFRPELPWWVVAIQTIGAAILGFFIGIIGGWVLATVLFIAGLCGFGGFSAAHLIECIMNRSYDEWMRLFLVGGSMGEFLCFGLYCKVISKKEVKKEGNVQTT